MRRRAKRQPKLAGDLTEKCCVCRKDGKVGDTIVITGDGRYVHVGACHRRLFESTLPSNVSRDNG